MKTTMTDNMSEEIERPNVHRFTTLKLYHWRENLKIYHYSQNGLLSIINNGT